MSYKSEVTFELRNAETLELESTWSGLNTVLQGRGLDLLKVGYELFPAFLGGTQWYTGGGNTGYATHSRLYMYTHDYSDNPGMFHYDNDHYYAADSATQLWAYVNSDVPYWEATFRFNAPTTDKVWKGAGLNVDLTHIRVNPHCIQTTVQVLDVRYRLFRQEALTDSDSTFIETEAAKEYFRNFSRQNNSLDNDYEHKMMVSPFKLNYGIQKWYMRSWDGKSKSDNEHRRSSFSYDKRQGKLYQNFIINKTEHVGVIYNSGIIGGTNYRQTFSRHNINYTAATGTSTVHHHNINSTLPYEDIDNLSSSPGTMLITDARAEKHIPEFIQIHYHDSGDVGETKYTIRKQHIIGYSGNNYKRSGRAASVNLGAMQGFNIMGNVQTNDVHGASTHLSRANVVELSPEEWVYYSRGGVSVVNVAEDKSVNFDSENYNFTASSIIEVTVDTDNRIIYVSCGATGLWKIEDPWGTPMVTNLSGGGLPIGSAIHIDVGYQGRVWAYFDGNLAYSDDYGTSWISNNPFTGTFSYTELTGEDEWGRCRDMVCDRVDPGHIVGLVLDNLRTDTDSLRILFYHARDLNYVQSVGDFNRYRNMYTLDTYSYSDGSDGVGLLGSTEYSKGLLKCAKRNSLWTLTVADDWNDDVYSNSYSINAYTGTNRGAIRGTYRYTASGFMYDNFDAPTYIYSDGVYETKVHASNKSVTADDDFVVHYKNDCQRHYQIINSESDPSYRGMVMNSAIGALNLGHAEEGRGSSISFLDRFDGPWGGKNTYFEDMSWSEYVWKADESKFVSKTDWMQDAVDSGSNSNNFHAKRKNFRPNEYKFRGRQYLDISEAAPDAGDTMTFITTYTSLSKSTQLIDPYGSILDIQLADHTEIRCYIQFSGDAFLHVQLPDGVWHTGVIPILADEEQRIGVVIDGTAVKVYIGGVADTGLDLVMDSIDFATVDTVVSGCMLKTKGYWTHKINPDHFLGATLSNMQVWDAGLTATDLQLDALDYAGLITPEIASGTNLRSRYLLSEPLDEARLTHTSKEIMVDGLEIQFIDGGEVGENSFTHTDYNTTTVCDGILSDNTNSFNFTTSTYIHPTDRKYSSLNNQSGISTVPDQAPEIQGAKLIFGSNGYYMNYIHGYAVHTYDSTYDLYNGRVTSYDRFDDEVMIEFQPHHEANYASIGFTALKLVDIAESRFRYSIRTNQNGFITVYENGVNVHADIAEYTVSSIFRIRRLTDGSFSLNVVDSDPGSPTFGDETELHTSAAVDVSPLFVGVLVYGYRSGFYNIRYTHTPRPGQAFIGHLIDTTGIYGEQFTATSSSAEDLLCKIDGVDTAVSILTSDDDIPMVALSAGEVRYYWTTGKIEFSVADYGKTLEFHTDAIYYPG